MYANANHWAQQATSLSKAINQLETPVKEKHVRQAIIGTFQEKGAQTFWMVTLRLPLQDNRIVAWKFCHVVHKVLREGHANCLPQSQRFRGKIDDLGKLWVHLREGYGKLINLYCSLLKTKLDFHRRNPRFPGNLVVTKQELEAIGENDINVYFHLSVEMFDYMDDVLALQSAIFGSLDMSRSNSMTSCGQCRVAPLIPCIQDAAQLYDYSVKILFKLHSALPPDTLDGHRKRFLKQFRDLKQFYQNSNTLQYFRNLISIPSLPENPPNFLIQAELRTYVTPVVILPPEPEPEPDPVVEGSLIDTSDSVDLDTASRNGSVSPVGSSHFIEVVAERDALIAHLQQEIGRLRQEMQGIIIEHKKNLSALQERITLLETELATRESELTQERQLKEDLFQQASAAVQNQDTEQKTKEEKFNKLKDVYTKLREEHIQLIRQKAEVDKKLFGCKKIVEELETKRTQLEAQVIELKSEKNKELENVQQSVKQQVEELEVLQAQHDYLKSENKNLTAKVDWVVKEKENIEYQLKELLEQKENLDVRLKSVNEHFVELDQSLEKERKSHEEQMKNILDKVILESENLVNHAVHEVDNPALSGATCGPDYFKSLVPGASDALNELKNLQNIKENHDDLVRITIQIGHRLSNLLLQGKATSNTSRNILFGEQMADECKRLGASVATLLQVLRSGTNIEAAVSDALTHLDALNNLVDQLSGQLKGDSADIIADLVDDELTQMDKAIEEAAKRIEDMLNKSRAADSGLKLEVNEKILDSCTTLMQAIRILVQKSKLLQGEIVAQGKGTASAKEFYKRNHRWTEGLISAAKAVGSGAKFLLIAADQVVSGQGKFEQIVVGAQEIAASTAQLVVASRVKAERGSKNLAGLSEASRAVTSATGGVVATSKACSQLVEENEELDTTGVSLHAAKRLEMEAQVRVLELEQSLQRERLRLSSLRRHHYQLAGEQEGWDIIEKEN
ncbi:huntingtin-interacting protein 1 isoform X2 [Chrysoperla carnea]|uniref:huntingtin-interacting protein 1 isoform X2 n=1 Tax=Chrysoperla carnea TaxID=189513 RepID=UPI001D065223|nr:huntingtin-interacting protein 1 isoform X2 [Chrysoperla carnea]